MELSVSARELQRQLDQGFLQDTHGRLIDADVSFHLYVTRSDVCRFSIARYAFRYREDPEGFTGIPNDGQKLLELSPENYAPLHRAVKELAHLIGRHGRAHAPVFLSDVEQYSWRSWYPKGLDTALDEYRFGEFRYETPTLTGLSRFQTRGIRFQPNNDPNEPTGNLWVDIPIAKERKDLEDAVQMADQIERILARV